VDAGWVTARHVLEGATFAILDTGGDGELVATILADDPLHDVIVFETEGSKRGSIVGFPVSREDASALPVGSSMRIIGREMQDLPVSLKRCQVMPPFGRQRVFTSAGEPGWSGSPVLSESGEVIGLIRGARGDGGYASPLDDALKGLSTGVPFEEWAKHPQPRPVQARAAFKVAVEAKKKGDIDAALAGYTEAITLEDGFAWARIGRADLYFDMRRFADAAADLQAAMTTGAEDPELHVLRMAAAAELRDCEALTESHAHLVRLWAFKEDVPLVYASALLKAGCIEEAISVLRPVLELPEVPDDGAALLAEALARSGDAEAALDLLTKHNLDGPRARQLKVIAPVILHGAEGVVPLQELMQPRANAFNRTRSIARYVVAMEVAPVMCDHLLEAIHPPTSSPEAAHLRGVIQTIADDDSGALWSFRKAVELDPEFWPSLIELAVVEAHMGELDAAIAHAETAVSISGGDSDARLVLATYLSEAGRYDESDAHARAVLETSGQRARVWWILGLNANRRGDNAEARSHYSTAVSHDPRDLRLRRSFVSSLRSAQDYPAALQQLHEMKAVSPEDRETAVLFAEVLLDSGEADASRIAAEEAGRLMVADDIPTAKRVVKLLCRFGSEEEAHALVNRLGLDSQLAQQILTDCGCTE
jgi:tetratricopeptide (TPR) repeat protein